MQTNSNTKAMINTISFKIDEDNDLYEITIDNKTYTIYDVYEKENSWVGDLFDELNILVDSNPIFHTS